MRESWQVYDCTHGITLSERLSEQKLLIKQSNKQTNC